MKSEITLGVDIGGSHITCALINLQSNKLLANTKVRMDVRSEANENDIVDRWVKAIEHSISFTESGSVKRIGISIPGPFQYDAGISLIKDQDKYDALYGLNIKNILAQRLNMNPIDIQFSNDATCFLSGEVLCGAAKNSIHAIGLTLGTGLGSAKFSNGLVEDADLWNSEFKNSIAEEYLSTRWFVNRYFELSGIKVSNVKDLIDNLTGDSPLVIDIFKEFGRNLGDFLIQCMINAPLAEVVVLGGNISKAYYLFGMETERCLKENGIDVQLKVAELGEGAALLGAVAAWNSYSAI